MRLKNLKELIHNSSQHFCQKAEVTVEFIEFKESEGQPDDIIREFSISRSVSKTESGTKFYIDQKLVEKKEVTNLLMEKGVDLKNNRFLILQGEVEAISLMKPLSGKQNDPGLLEYLEDIIGSN